MHLILAVREGQLEIAVDVTAPEPCPVPTPMVAGAMTKRAAAMIIRNVAGVVRGSLSNKLGININDH